MSVDGVNADKYSGTRLLAVLNIKDFNCFARLSAMLSQLRTRRIWTDLCAALFCSFSSF